MTYCALKDYTILYYIIFSAVARQRPLKKTKLDIPKKTHVHFDPIPICSYPQNDRRASNR